ncbi:hypothetical protein ACFLXE_06300 [Chloroflexota bacterium]
MKIPESKRFTVNLVVGAPDSSSPVVTFRAGCEPLETLVAWHSFD